MIKEFRIKFLIFCRTRDLNKRIGLRSALHAFIFILKFIKQVASSSNVNESGNATVNHPTLKLISVMICKILVEVMSYLASFALSSFHWHEQIKNEQEQR